MSGVYCSCGREETIRTSWTTRNPDRRFDSCPIRGAGCNCFLGWVNELRHVDLIPGLLSVMKVLEDSNDNLKQTNNDLKAKLKASEDETKILRKYLVVSWLIIAIIGSKMVYVISVWD